LNITVYDFTKEKNHLINIIQIQSENTLGSYIITNYRELFEKDILDLVFEKIIDQSEDDSGSFAYRKTVVILVESYDLDRSILSLEDIKTILIYKRIVKKVPDDRGSRFNDRIKETRSIFNLYMALISSLPFKLSDHREALDMIYHTDTDLSGLEDDPFMSNRKLLKNMIHNSKLLPFYTEYLDYIDSQPSILS
jgi:hypothetical protein